jgi:hypothetical protein
MMTNFLIDKKFSKKGQRSRLLALAEQRTKSSRSQIRETVEAILRIGNIESLARN